MTRSRLITAVSAIRRLKREGKAMHPVIFRLDCALRAVVGFVKNEREPPTPEREAEFGHQQRPGKLPIDRFGRTVVTQQFFDMDPPNSH